MGYETSALCYATNDEEWYEETSKASSVMSFSSLPLVPNAYVATRVAEKGQVTTVINNGPQAVFIGTYDTVRNTDQDAIQIPANVFLTWDGRSNLYASLPSGQATISKLVGIVNMGML